MREKYFRSVSDRRWLRGTVVLDEQKNSLVYFQIVVVLFYDILQHNRILIKKTLQTVIRIIVLLNNIYKCQALIRT